MIKLPLASNNVVSALTPLAAGSPVSSGPVLIAAIVVSIAVIVVLITVLKLHPFLSLTIGAGVMALVAGMPIQSMFTSFTKGVGSTIGDVGVLIAFGAITGYFLTASGGAGQIVDTMMTRTKSSMLPWTIALIAMIIGIPLFFEVGVVLLVPIVLMVAARTRKPVMLLAIPALAGLSTLHGFVPPHPGPLTAVNSLGANIGMTLWLGLLVAVPVLIVSGPLLALLVVRLVPKIVDSTDDAPGGAAATNENSSQNRPSFWLAIGIVLLPVILMLLHAIAEAAIPQATLVFRVLAFIGTPIVALGASALASIIFLGRYVGDRTKISKGVDASLASIASIVFIVGAGGGFKQTIVDTGVAKFIGAHAEHAHLSPLLLAWLIAVFVRLATGSATVATVTTAGIVAPLAADLSNTHLSLMVLSIGAGSVFLSHVNDAGFWLVKEYFGLTVGQTFKSWSLMESVLSVTGLGVVMAVSAFV